MSILKKITLPKIVLWIWLAFAGFFVTAVLYFYLLSINFIGLFGLMPNLTELENPRSELASEMYSADNVLIGKYFRENRSKVEFDEVSKNMLNALVATEDVRFEEHSGIDFWGLFRAIIKLGKDGGGSTITQQLAKNLFGIREKYEGGIHKLKIKKLNTVINKTKEWLVSVILERSYTKKEIVMMYLNTVDYGSNAYGLQVASQTFFGKNADSLKVEEAAVLVGVLKGPSIYSPIFNPKRSLNRRNTVLEQMRKYNFLTTTQCDSLKKLPITLNYSVENHNSGSATYFRSVIRDYLLKWCRDNGYDLYTDGLKVYTTIDSRLQKHAEDAVTQHMSFLQAQFYEHWKGKRPWVDENFKEIPGFIENVMKRTDRYRSLKAKYGNNNDSIMAMMRKPIKMKIFSWHGERDTLMSPLDSIKYYKYFLQCGLLSMEPTTGHIKAWVGGINFKYFKYDHVKQGKRQPGSTFKPIVYSVAIDNGYSPCYEIPDSPVSFVTMENGEEKTWTPQNSTGEFTGEKLTLRSALARSINSVTAYLMKQFGPPTIVEYARKLGITSELDPQPALCLGSSDLSIYELTGAYSTFANGGTYIEPFFVTRIEDKNGNVLIDFLPRTIEALNEESAYLMIHMLKGSSEEKDGTALALRGRYAFRNEIAAKTGTTSNYSDGWFVGLVPQLTTGIWVGAEERAIHFRNMTWGQGARSAMPIWAYYMQRVYADKSLGIEPLPFPRPSKALKVEINCKKFKASESDTSKSSQENTQQQILKFEEQ